MVETYESDFTQIGLHSIKNILGNQNQLSLFSEHDVEFSTKFGLKLEGKIDRFGIDLTNIQAQVMEGILYGFSKTNYKGNLNPLSPTELLPKIYKTHELPESYKYIQEIPVLKASQRDILEWSGVQTNIHIVNEELVS